MSSSISLVDSNGNPNGSQCDFPVVGSGYTYIPGMQFILQRDIADAATADYEMLAPCALRVIDVWCEKRLQATGVNANTVQVFKAAAAISNALALTGVSEGAVVRTTSLGASGVSSFAKDAVIKTTVTKAGGDAAVRVYIACVAS